MEATTSFSQSGTFYITNTGGKGCSHNIILMLAVNGTIPEDFRAHIQSSGYVFPLLGKTDLPDVQSQIYYDEVLNETFTRDDFVYGPQIWKPYNGRDWPAGQPYPIYHGQDMSDTGDAFQVMFIDLNAGVLTGVKDLGALTDGGALKIDYSFENLESTAAFNIYALYKTSEQPTTLQFTNRLDDTSATHPSGYVVMPVPDEPAELQSIAVSPSSNRVVEGNTTVFAARCSDQFGRTMDGIPVGWRSDNETVGTIDPETGVFLAENRGTAVITASSGGIEGSATVTVLSREEYEWTITLKGVRTEIMNRTTFLALAENHSVTYTDRKGREWNGLPLSVLVGRVDDSHPESVNQKLAAYDYRITVNGTVGNGPKVSEFKSVAITGAETDAYIVANRLGGEEIPVGDAGGKVYWPLTMRGSAITGTGDIVDQITGIELTLPTEKLVYYVDDSGGADYTTIRDAVDAAKPGDTIIVKDGTYYESVTIDKSLTLISENGPESTIIQRPPDEPESRILVGLKIVAGGVEIRGFSVTGFTYQLGTATESGILCAPDCVVSDCIVENCYDGIDGDATDGVVRDNVVNNCSRSSGIHISGERVLVTNNNISQCYNAIIAFVIDSTISGNCGTDNKKISISLKDSKGSIVSENNFTEVFCSNGIAIQKSSDIAVRDNSLCDFTYSFGIPLVIRESKNITLENNFLSNIGHSAISITRSLNVSVTNNSIKDSGKYDLYIGYESNPIITGNTIDSNNTALMYLNKNTEPVILYLNTMLNHTVGISLRRSSAGTWNSTEPITYVYDGNTYTGYVGNYWDTYTGVDRNGDGIGDTPFNLTDDNIDFYPLMQPIERYRVAVASPDGESFQKNALDIPGCEVVPRGGGMQAVSINTSAVNATVSENGTRVRVTRSTFDLIMNGNLTVEGDTINGTVTGIGLESKPVATRFDTLGLVTTTLAANLTGLPAGAALETTVSQNVSADARSAFQIAATADGLNLDAVAYTMNIKKTNLANGQDIADATITMTVSPAWVDAHGGVDAVRIIRSAEDGTKEVLETVLIGTDADGNMVFEAFSPKGLSVFGLTAVTKAAEPPATSSSSGGSGSSDVAAISGSIPAGESQTFAVSKTAVRRITVEADDRIGDLLVTVQKASLSKNMDAPGPTTFEIVETTLYRADPSTIAGVTIEFSVPSTWLKAHGLSTDKIVLLQYEDGAWKPLKTAFVKEENGQALYSAEASGFSYFAIASGEAASAAGQVGETETPAPAVTDAPAVEETTVPATTAPTQKSPVFWALSLVAIGVVFILKRG
ncbi:PGF-pre-PGF domain-containing protein [Methanofollis formosanus]|nr:NosD domain-containing protein [Methanofollis formosanus]